MIISKYVIVKMQVYRIKKQYSNVSDELHRLFAALVRKESSVKLNYLGIKSIFVNKTLNAKKNSPACLSEA